MRIDISLIPDEFQSKVRSAKQVVVIDVLRASSSVITALGHGARCVIPAVSKNEALLIGARKTDIRVLYCGEKGGLKIKGFNLGNSPKEYTKKTVSGKTLIFVSTNGSPMMVRTVEEKKSLFIAGFMNIHAAAMRIRELEGNCLLACSGREGRFSLEDVVCAGMLALEIQKNSRNTPALSDEARSAVVLYRHFADDLLGMARNSLHGKYLSSLGLGGDIPICVSLNRFKTVPEFKKGALSAD
jgi:2-phosphosulfolactate phosphatase